jgi:hypothetical protein
VEQHLAALFDLGLRDDLFDHARPERRPIHDSSERDRDCRSEQQTPDPTGAPLTRRDVRTFQFAEHTRGSAARPTFDTREHVTTQQQARRPSAGFPLLRQGAQQFALACLECCSQL